MDTATYITYRHLYHPKLPLNTLEFLKTELKLGNKHVIANLDQDAFAATALLLKHVHLVCHIHPSSEEHSAIKKTFVSNTNFIISVGEPQKTNLDNDAIDCILIGNNFVDYTPETLKEECKHIARLNSFVLIINHKISLDSSPFAKAYNDFIQRFSTTGVEEYNRIIPRNALDKFYQNGYEQKQFPNQQRFDLEGITAYYLSSKTALKPEHPQYQFALKALKILFYQYQENGQVHLEYQTFIYFGLFNKYVPAISLRKSMFFNFLRPFAFGFYILVKMNIYLLKGIYTIKEKLFPKRSKRKN
ncbi:MAG: hypothetical protein MK212_02380 [Saprospiraceae bacterium]|nr:hypothetical protein [Saprospiraceae bacterium]